MTFDENMPLTAAQEAIWNAQQLDPESPYYVVGEVLELRGDVDTAALAESVRRTVDEAETLRLRITETPKGPRQWVDPAPAQAPAVRDLSSAPDPQALATAVIDAEKADAGRRWRAMVGTELHRYLILRLSADEIWCVQLYHHIIVDGYAAALLTRRISAHYTALITGKEVRPTRFGSIADTVQQDTTYRDSADRIDDAHFWTEELTPRPSTIGREDHVGGSGERSITTTLRLSSTEFGTLRDSASAVGVTWADLALAGWAHLVRRLLRTDETVIAMPMSARTSAAMLRTPSMTVNMLPLVTRPQETLAEEARDVADSLARIRDHRRFPGSALPELLGDLSTSSLLHGIGANIKAFDYRLTIPGVHAELRNIAGGPPEDLVLVVTPSADGGLDLGFETDPDRVPASLAMRRLRDLKKIMLSDVHLPHPPLRDTAERAAIAADRLGAPAPDQNGVTLRSLIEALGENTNEALVDGTTSLTGAELLHRIRSGAAALDGEGVVAVDLPKSIDAAVVLLACLYAGRPFVMLDREHPEQRRRALIRSSGATTLVDEGWLREKGDVGKQLVKEPAGDALAYLVYTSGSTGEPKGVEITRDALLALVQGNLADLHRDVASRVQPRIAHTASFAFDAALEQLLWILTGATVDLCDRDDLQDPQALIARIQERGITVIDATPSLAGALVEHGLLESGLDTVILGGEALPSALWNRLVESDVTAWNLYGPSEATIDALAAKVTSGPPTLGRPVTGMTVELLDPRGEPVPDGEIGELHLSGPQIARGYLGGARFDGSYATGDLARWIPGRGYEFLGRADDQVEIRGHRVELTEVESALSSVPGIGAVTVGVDSGRLIAHVVTDLPSTEVIAAVARQVPDHLVPSRVITMDALPLTVNGKVDRAALQALPDVPLSTPTSSTPEETIVSEVVGEMLGTGPAPIDKDWISLGGDSITAITASARLHGRGLDISPAALLSGRELATLAAEAGNTQAVAGNTDITVEFMGIPALQIGAHPAETLLATPMEFTVGTGVTVDRDLLIKAVADITMEHGALRTITDVTDGRVLVPRVPLASAAAHIDTAPDPARGLAWTITIGDGELTVAGVLPESWWPGLLAELEEQCTGLTGAPVDSSMSDELREKFRAPVEAALLAAVRSTDDPRRALLSAKEDLVTGTVRPILLNRWSAPITPQYPEARFRRDPDGSIQVDGSDQVRVELESITQFVETSAGGASPTDLSISGVGQERIDVWEGDVGRLDDVLPLSPLQEGLLFHALASDERDPYVLAAGIDIPAPVDAERMRRAFSDVVHRHHLLRAFFDIDDEPLQVIPHEVDVPWSVVDLRELALQEARTRADSLRAAMAHRTVNVLRGPLVEAQLVLFPDDCAQLILGNHHLLTDGWSTPVMLRDLAAFYYEEELPEAASFRDYLEHIGARDTDADDRRWRELLGGLESGTLVQRPDAGQPGDEIVTPFEIDEETSTALTAVARRCSVTPSTLLQAAWAVSLSMAVGKRDVVFGVTVSGRPAEIDAIGETVGMFINTLPMRIRVDPNAPLRRLLSDLSEMQSSLADLESSPLGRIERNAGVGALFDTLVVFDNFPTSDLGFGELHVEGRTHFPMSVVAPPAERFVAGTAHHPCLISDSLFSFLHQTTEKVLVAIAEDPDSTVADAVGEIEAPTVDLAPAPTEVETTPAASRTELSAKDVAHRIAAETAELLGLDSVDLDAGFYDIGGHSLAAIRLLGRLRGEFPGISIEDIIVGGTANGMAARLTGGQSRMSVTEQLRGGFGDPIFCIHPGGGLVLPFRPLAEKLALPNPIVGLRLPSPLPEEKSLADLAIRYLAEIREVQPHGPYRLLGYSFGGMMAQTIAALLQADGEDVEFLGILDAYPAGRGPQIGADLARANVTADLAGLPGGDTNVLVDNVRYCASLMRNSVPSDYSGPVLVVTATEAPDGAAFRNWDPAGAWRSEVGDDQVTEHRVATTHGGLCTEAGWAEILPVIREHARPRQALRRR